MTTENNEDPFEGGRRTPLYGHDWIMKEIENTFDALTTRYNDSRHLVKPIGLGTHTSTSAPLSAGFAVIWWGPDFWLESSYESMKIRFGWIQNHIHKSLTGELRLSGSGTINTPFRTEREDRAI